MLLWCSATRSILESCAMSKIFVNIWHKLLDAKNNVFLNPCAMVVKMTPAFRTKSPPSLLVQFAEAGLSGDHQKLELLALTAVRSLKRTDPGQADELASLLSRFTVNSASLRWRNAPPPPEDADAGLALLRIPSTDQAQEPELEPHVRGTILRFLAERRECASLIAEGIAPPRTLLLKGAPGTGKTMLACWMAKELEIPLVVLDLATSISSYLGKTGANLRRSLDYARATPCLLLLDEFDSIAKRRDDASDVGELKRIVNVLLKELEEWPLHSVLVAATNHPEMLDPAIQRRFDVVAHLPLPGQTERFAILGRSLGRHAESLPGGFVDAMAAVLTGLSGSDVTTLSQGALRRHLVGKIPLAQCLAETLESQCSEGMPKAIYGNLVRCLKNECRMTVRKIAEILGKGSSTIQYHLKKEKANA